MRAVEGDRGKQAEAVEECDLAVSEWLGLAARQTDHSQDLLLPRSGTATAPRNVLGPSWSERPSQRL